MLIENPLVLFILIALNAGEVEGEPLIEVAAGVPGLLKLIVPPVVKE